MTTTIDWWNNVKRDNEKLCSWLCKQYRGEVTAATRIELFANKYADGKNKKTLLVIAKQERQHAAWVLGLLHSRKINPEIDDAEKRYWSETLPEIDSFETGAAVGAHAEAMRLERIKVISSDSESPPDIRMVFERILKDEIFHERAFRMMAGSRAMLETLDAHNRGKELLGLEH